MEFRCGRIVTAKPPRRRHYGEIRYGVPDELPRDAALAASYGGQSREQPKAASRDLAQRARNSSDSSWSGRCGKNLKMTEKTKWWHLVLAWGFVGAPLAWGVVQTIFNAAKLFG